MKVILISEEKLDQLLEEAKALMFRDAKSPDGKPNHTDATVRCRTVNYDLHLFVDAIKKVGI